VSDDVAPTPQPGLERYVSRFATDWTDDTTWRELDATLVYVDVSGFTALSERLARRGRIGAEELTDILNHVFSQMLAVAYSRRGSLLKFGGDALLLLFSGDDDHPSQACSAAVEMQDVLRRAVDYRTSAGRLRLKMSVGIHSGNVHLFRVGTSHHELIITGPAASETTEMEETAVAGEILVSSSTRAALPPGSAPTPKGSGWLLKWRKARVDQVATYHRSSTTESEQCIPLALRDHLRQGVTEPEHHIATVGFVKYTGMDALMEEGGPAAAADALDRLVTIVQQHVDEESVTFLASDIDQDGGKIILVAGVPRVQEDDEGRVLRAARGIVDDAAPLPLEVRAGVNHGHVFVGEIGTEFRSTYTIMGDTVNLAARLMATAAPGELYAAPSALAASATLFTSVALEPFYVKGKEHAVQAYSLGAAVGGRPVERSDDLPFTGRDTERALLLAAIDALRVGRGAAFTIVGERGIGKGRLVDEALASSTSEALHIAIRGESYGTATPYRAMRDPMRLMFGLADIPEAELPDALCAVVADQWPDVLPHLPLLGDVMAIPVPSTLDVDLIEPQFRVARSADLLMDLLARSFDGPVVFQVEDAQHLDEASAHGLVRVVELGSKHPWLVLATTTDVTSGMAPIGIPIHLERLTPDEARALVNTATEAAPRRPHEIDAIIDRAAGLPLFLEEILRSLRQSGDVASLPDSLEAVVSAQIDALAPLTRRLLQFCSVLGTSFSVARINELVAPENIRLDAATRRALRQFLDNDGTGRLRFRQTMTRDVAYGGLSFKRRRELHARAAEVFEGNAGGTEAVADMLALHHSLAGNHEQTWRYARMAGDQAAGAYANIDAATHYERALEAARRLTVVPDTERAEMWAAMAVVRERSGFFDAALDAYRNAGRLVKGDAIAEVDLILERAALRRRSEGGYRQALRELTSAMRRLGDADTDQVRRRRARIDLERAFVRRRQQRPADALNAAVSAEKLARELGDLETVGRALDIAYWANLMSGRADIEPPYGETLQIFEKIGDLRSVAEVLNNLGADAYYGGRWTEATDAYRRSREADLRTGNDVAAAISAANIAELAVSQGRFDEAEPLLEDAIRVLTASKHGSALMFAQSEQARMLLLRGDVDRAAALLIEIRSDAEAADEAMALLNITLLEAELEVRSQRPDAALTMIESAALGAGEMAELLAPTLGRLRGRALANLGDAEGALNQYDSALHIAADQGLPYDRALLLMEKDQVCDGGLAEDQRRELDELITTLDLRIHADRP
jgi:class 3 adenylate cyclase/tetratricopeptide (TPR) repeat protein